MGFQGGFTSLLPRDTPCATLVLDLASVFLCLSGFFSSFSLLVLSKCFPSVSWTLLVPVFIFPGPSLGGRSRGSPAAPSVSPCPAVRAPAVPLAAVPPAPPPHPPPPRGRAVTLHRLSAGAGRLRRCPCAGTAWHGQADEPRQLLAAGPGAVGSPHLPCCVLGLWLGRSSHPRWPRGGVHRASSPPIPHLINEVGGPPLSQGVPGHRCTQTPGRWSLSPPVPLPPRQVSRMPHGGVRASSRAGVCWYWSPLGMRQRWAVPA